MRGVQTGQKPRLGNTGLFTTQTLSSRDIPNIDIQQRTSAKKKNFSKKRLTKLFQTVKKSHKQAYFVSCLWGVRISAETRKRPKTLRPHYHCAVYNYKPTDLKFYKKNHTNDILYTSKTLERIWGNGYAIIGELTYESTAYIARYVVKKAFGITNELHIKNKRQPEFILTSRRPGLADEIRKYPIWEHIKKNGNVLIKTKNGVIARPIPQYLRKKWKDFETREDYFRKLQENHKANVQQMNEQTDQNSKTFWWLLKQKRATLLKKITHLPRKDLTNLAE